MNTSDIGLAFIEFNSKSGGKKRPILIMGSVDGHYLAFSITSKFKNKSPKIKAVYYQIQNWREAGLNFPSWIDTGHVLYLAKDRHIQKIGKLLDSDKEKLIQFLIERTSL